MQDLEINLELKFVSLENLINIWSFEQQQLNQAKDSKGSNTKNIVRLSLVNPEIFAPLSFLLAAGVSTVGKLTHPIINKSNLEASTRLRVLTQVLHLHGAPYSSISWANSIEINHYVSWLVGELNNRLATIKKIDMDVCDSGEAKDIENKIKQYTAVVDELNQFLLNVMKEQRHYEKQASDHESLAYEVNQERLSEYRARSSEIQKKIKNILTKSEAGLISKEEAKQQKIEQEKLLHHIEVTLCCSIPGCKNVKSSESNYCQKHKCREVGCNKNIEALGDDTPVLLGSIMKGAAAIIGNANSSHIIDISHMFCESHQPTLNIDPPTKKSPLKKTEGLSANQKFIIIFPFAFISLFFALIFFT